MWDAGGMEGNAARAHARARRVSVADVVQHLVDIDRRVRVRAGQLRSGEKSSKRGTKLHTSAPGNANVACTLGGKCVSPTLAWKSKIENATG